MPAIIRHDSTVAWVVERLQKPVVRCGVESDVKVHVKVLWCCRLSGSTKEVANGIDTVPRGRVPMDVFAELSELRRCE
jgi:hypothetical protein